MWRFGELDRPSVPLGAIELESHMPVIRLKRVEETRDISGEVRDGHYSLATLLV